MTADDVPAIAALEAMCFSEPWSEASLYDTLSSPDAMLVCAVLAETVIGYGGIYLSPAVGDFPGEGNITNIAVLPAYRGRGIGRTLLLSLLEAAMRRGAKEIFLEVRVSNASAIRLYEAVGFDTVGTRKNFYKQPREDALIMKCAYSGTERQHETDFDISH